MTGKSYNFLAQSRKITPVSSLRYFTMQKSEDAFISCKSHHLGNLNYYYFFLE